MKKNSLIAWAFCLLVLASCGKTQTLPVMSYNIRYGTADDGENSWPQRREAACAMINEQRPAVFGVSSPQRYATNACAHSCNVRLISSRKNASRCCARKDTSICCVHARRISNIRRARFIMKHKACFGSKKRFYGSRCND